MVFQRLSHIVFVTISIILLSQASSMAMEQTAITSSLVLKVADRDQVAQRIINKAEEMDGWFFQRTDNMVQLQVPASTVQAFIAFARQQGVVADRTHGSDYLGDQLSEQLASLKSKESLLAQYFEVLENAEQESIITVEREIVSLTEKIERLKGQIRFIRHRTQFAKITITFQFRDRSAPAADGTSSFPWLNTMNITDLVGDFQYAH